MLRRLGYLEADMEAAMATGYDPWGVVTIDLKTPERGHHTLFLSHYLHYEGGNSDDDRSGRVCGLSGVGFLGGNIVKDS